MGIEAAIIGGSALGAISGSRSAKKAAKAQKKAAQSGIAEQRRQFDKMLELNQPFIDAGTQSVNELARLFAGDRSGFFTSPDFQFRREQGLEGIAQTLGAGGQGAFSGNALRELNNFNSNLASGEFGDFVNRRLALAGLGGANTQQTGSAAVNTGLGIANQMQQMGNARASGILGQGLAINQGINGLSQLLLLRNMGLLGGGGNAAVPAVRGGGGGFGGGG